MATYVNDLRLTEIATGDETGDWGATTNTNLELIAEAFSFGTEAITTNADTHTTTIADGGTDPGRSLFLKYTGTLDSACTITIAPNTVSKLWFIENGTSGSQNIIISQGSGANITIPPGDTKAIYSDGAGSGAAMVDAFASLSVVDLKVQDDLTVTDDMTVGGTLGVTGVLTGTSLDISGDIDVDGTTNLDAVDIDGAVQLDATLTVGANDQGYNVTLYGDTASTYALWNSSADTLLFSDNAKAVFGTGNDMQLYHDGTNSYITNSQGELKLATETSGIALAIGHSTSEVTFGDNVTVTGDFTVNGTTTTIATTNLTVTDPLVKFGQGYTGTAYDQGFIVTRGNGSASNTANKGFIWDETADEFAAVACNTEDGTTAGNVTINSYSDLQVAKLTGTSLDISGDIDVDGTTNLDIVDIDGAVDMASTLTVNDSVTLQSSGSSKPILTLKNTNADTTPPTITFQKDSASPADGDEIANFNFYGDDSGGNVAAYAGLKVLADDVTDGTEDGSIHLKTMVAGTFADRVVIGTTLNSSVKIVADAGIDIDNINIDGTTIALSSGNLTLDVAGDIVLDAADNEIVFKSGGTQIGFVSMASSDLTIESVVSDKDIILRGNDGGSAITALTLDMSAAGQAAFNKGATFGASVTAETDTDTSNTGNVTLDYAAHQNFVLTLTGNTTLVNPTTEVVGQSGFISFIQDGTGSRVLSVGSQYFCAGGAVIVLSTAANSIDIVPYVVIAAGKVCLGAPQLAFADAS